MRPATAVVITLITAPFIGWGAAAVVFTFGLGFFS